MPCFEYGPVELDHLRKNDKKLGAAMDRIGLIERPVNPDLFAALVGSIVAQQISAKAAQTVWNRLEERLLLVSPASVCAASHEDVQQCGLSMRKVGYIKGIAAAVQGGNLDLALLAHMPDEEVVSSLITLPGVGVWTAEMMLIFSLQRPDVVSWGDLAIRRGMMTLYGYEKLEKKDFERHRRGYSP